MSMRGTNFLVDRSKLYQCGAAGGRTKQAPLVRPGLVDADPAMSPSMRSNAPHGKVTPLAARRKR